MSGYSRRTLGRARTLEFLAGLAAAPGDEALAIYLPPRTPPKEVAEVLKILPAASETASQLTGITIGAATGAVIFWSRDHKYLVLPPFPLTEKCVLQSLDTEKMSAMLARDYLIALVLVRLGSYAIGVARGEKLISSKVGTGLVHGRHRQGGSSAHRFERHRDKQMETFLNRVDGHIKEYIGPYVKSLDYIVYGGARTTILLLQKYCPLLMKITTPALPPLLDIPDPRLPVLESAIARVYSSTVMEWD